MRVSDTNKNRGAHGDSSFKLGGMPSSSENPPALAVGSVNSSFYQDNPCMECQPPQRQPGCHSSCPAYKKWRHAVEERKAKYWEDRSKADMLDSMENARKKSRGKRR